MGYYRIAKSGYDAYIESELVPDEPVIQVLTREEYERATEALQARNGD